MDPDIWLHEKFGGIGRLAKDHGYADALIIKHFIALPPKTQTGHSNKRRRGNEGRTG